MDQRTLHLDLDLELLLLLELLQLVGVLKRALQRLLNHFKGLKQPKQLSLLLQDLLLVLLLLSMYRWIMPLLLFFC